MDKNKISSSCKEENGNVLFLILIAVALFAALSYAVTSSTRSSGGDVSSETNLISSAQITQYAASVGPGLIRMIISGISVDEIRFNRPSEFADLTSDSTGAFHPAGGGLTYVTAPADVMTSGNAGEWVFNANMEIPNIGLAGAGGNDVIAFLIGVRQSICSRVNEEFGIGTTIPVITTDISGDYSTRMYHDGSVDYVFPTTDQPDIDDGSNSFDGQPFGCFRNTAAGDFVYYHVVLER